MDDFTGKKRREASDDSLPLDGKAAHPDEARRVAANIAKLLTRPRLNTGFR